MGLRVNVWYGQCGGCSIGDQCDHLTRVCAHRYAVVVMAGAGKAPAKIAADGDLWQIGCDGDVCLVAIVGDLRIITCRDGCGIRRA